MRILAIIPARGGSKRIPRKNIKDFCGKPVIAYSIEAALESGAFAEVMVSTDDVEIAATARACGAEVPFMRSAATSGDFATTADVLLEVLDRYEALGKRFEAIACIYATAPFVTAGRLAHGAGILAEGKAESAFTCVQYSYPIQRSLVIDGGSQPRVRMQWPEYASARSQDLQAAYHDAGQFYFCTTERLRADRSLWGAGTVPIVLPELEVQDLDTPVDWQLAEMKYRMLHRFPGRFSADGYTFIPFDELDRAMSEWIWRGRNLAEVRCRMFHDGPIPRDEHETFMNALQERTDCRHYAVFRDGKPVGSVNLHDLGHGICERGIWIHPDAQRKGHALRLLKAFYNRISSAPFGWETVVTRVKEDNTPSSELEKRLGAVLKGCREGCVEYELRMR